MTVSRRVTQNRRQLLLVGAMGLSALTCGGPTEPSNTNERNPDPCFKTTPTSLGCNIVANFPSLLAVGQTVQLIATARSDVYPLSAVGPPTWSSSNPGVATVGVTSGVLVGVSRGTATITVSVVENYASRTLSTNSDPITVDVASPFDGEWTGPSVGGFGPFELRVTLGVVRNWTIRNVSAALSGGGVCRHDVITTVSALIASSGAFSDKGLTGTFSSTTTVSGRYPSFVFAGGAECPNVSGSVTIPGGDFTATKR
jgi:hypothetical protein